MTGPQAAEGDQEPPDTWLYDAVFNRTDGDDDPAVQRRAAYDLGRAAERERADKAEALIDELNAEIQRHRENRRRLLLLTDQERSAKLANRTEANRWKALREQYAKLRSEETK